MNRQQFDGGINSTWLGRSVGTIANRGILREADDYERGAEYLSIARHHLLCTTTLGAILTH